MGLWTAGGQRPPLRPIRGLLFDMGDVLYDATLWRRWLHQLLHRFGLNAPYRTFYQTWERDYLDAVYRGQRPFDEAFEAFLLASGLTRPQVDEVQAACQARRRRLDEFARPLPGVRIALARLQMAGLLLGVLTNAEHDSETLCGRLLQFGIAQAFSVVISSVNLGRTMPDPECYREALNRLMLRADQVAFVGHGAAELSGAHQAGMMTIAFNDSPDVVADAFVSRFDEIVYVVGWQSSYAAAGRNASAA